MKKPKLTFKEKRKLKEEKKRKNEKIVIKRENTTSPNVKGKLKKDEKKEKVFEILQKTEISEEFIALLKKKKFFSYYFIRIFRIFTT